MLHHRSRYITLLVALSFFSAVFAEQATIPSVSKSLYASDEEINQAVERVDTIDPRFIVFSTVGSTYMADFQKASGKINLVFCNTADDSYKIKGKKDSPITRNIRSISKPSDLENLLPVRETTKFTIPKPIKVDKKYPGCRSNYIGIGLENLFKAIGIYPNMAYKGKVLIDEYKLGLPIKISLNNVAELRALLVYYTTNLFSQNLAFPTLDQRPLLLLDCAEELRSLDNNTAQLLHSLFVVANPKNDSIKTFYNDLMDSYLDALSKDGDHRKEAVGEKLLRKLEDATCEFEIKTIAIEATFIVISALILLRIKGYLESLDKTIGKAIDPYDPVKQGLNKLDGALNGAH